MVYCERGNDLYIDGKIDNVSLFEQVFKSELNWDYVTQVTNPYEGIWYITGKQTVCEHEFDVACLLHYDECSWFHILALDKPDCFDCTCKSCDRRPKRADTLLKAVWDD